MMFTKLRYAVLLLTSGLLLAGCGYKSSPEDGMPRATTAGSAPRSHPLHGVVLDGVRQEISAAIAPSGMDSSLFEELRASLLAAVGSRSTSTPPAGDQNILDDITFVDAGGGDYTLTWTYKNVGDYDINGEVNISDLTPIGLNFRATTASATWPAARAADGDLNGEVNLADVTPIGLHYQAQVGSYHIYGGNAEFGPWTFVGETVFGAGNFGTYPPAFSYHIGPATHSWYLVVPADFAGVDNINGGGGGGDGATVNVGSATVDTSQQVTQSGGTISGPAGTPIEGISVMFPPGAVDAPANISLGHTDGSIVPVEGNFGGTILSLNTDGSHQFYEPVVITAPLPASDALPIPYYINDQQQLQVMDLADVDPGAGTFSFYTWHASFFGWLWENPPSLNWRDGSYYSSFFAQNDGFQVTNSGSTFNVKGECHGMTAFAQWYKRNQSASEGDFYPRFMSQVGSSGRSGQQIIATRAHTSVAVVWNSYVPDVVSSQGFLTDVAVYRIIKNAIANTAQPVMLYISTDSNSAHAIIARAVDNGTVWLYDPNVPYNSGSPSNSEKFLSIGSSIFDEFADYGSYTNFYYMGDGSLYINEPYNRIYQDARADFNGNDKAQVTITSHASGDTVTERNPTLVGQIQSGNVLIDQLAIISNGVTVETPVDQTGNFTVVVPLKAGDNYLEFCTRGIVTGQGRIAVPNDQLDRFKLIYDGETTTVLVTLTWDQPVDIDLYVTDPTGSTSWYSSKSTPDGGELDVDNTYGYGPEHFTLTSADTTRFDQPYIVKVHKYTGGDLFTKWTLSVQLNEGDPIVETGSLTFGDSSNSDPGATGSDWGGFIEVTPVQPQQ